jgi:hypothetical protein
LKRAFSGQSMVDFHAADTFLKWVDVHRDAARSALMALWVRGDSSPVERVRNFLAEVPEDAIKAPGARLNIASFLLLGIDPTANPLYKPSSVKGAFELAGWGLPPKEPEDEMYRSFLALCDELVHDCPALDHRLDAQGALWALTKYDWTGDGNEKPSTWSDREWRDFLAYLGRQPVVQPGGDGGGDPSGRTSYDLQTERRDAHRRLVPARDRRPARGQAPGRHLRPARHREDMGRSASRRGDFHR